MTDYRNISHIERLLSALHHNPFQFLGRHHINEQEEVIRVFLPHAVDAYLLPDMLPLHQSTDSPLFEWQGAINIIPLYYQIKWFDKDNIAHCHYDPYCFPSQLNEYDMYLFNTGKHWYAQQFLGAHLKMIEGITGILFTVWAPHALRVSVVGDFNQWDIRTHPMRSHSTNGLWELFIPNLAESTLYKFDICHIEGEQTTCKADPYAQAFELRPHTASRIIPPSKYLWQDDKWMQARVHNDWRHKPMSIYEVHLGSWQRDEDNNFLNYREIAHKLVDYVIKLGFTHIELLPITEHPLDESWGYQVTGYYAPTSRYGTPDDFRYFIDYCHQHHISVILDWVPAHFPKDAHGLANFDGEALYEYADPRKGIHHDWGTLVFNYNCPEVRCFLISNAIYWLKEFHLDGLRVDAVASMLYLDYSRAEGEWVANIEGGHENIEAISFLRELNTVVQTECTGALMIAEESTSWPKVTRPPWEGGLGFTMKWNMGWMHDSLHYFGIDPVYRTYHHEHLSFGMTYSFGENYILHLSHDEVVHGKQHLYGKMIGDEWQHFAHLRLLYTYMWTCPGKKLLFMGSEFAQLREWNVLQDLDWVLTKKTEHAGLQLLIADLNHLYNYNTALHYYDFEQKGFTWLDCHNNTDSVLSFMRHSDNECLIIILNFTPQVQKHYCVGVPLSGSYQEIFNSDSQFYGGSNIGNVQVSTDMVAYQDQPHSLSLTLPPLAGIILQREEHVAQTVLC